MAEDSERMRAAVARGLAKARRKKRVGLRPGVVETLCDQLLACEPAGRRLFLRRVRRATRPETVRRLIERSAALRHVDPEQGEVVARLAVEAAALARRWDLPPRLLADLRTEALLNLANVERIRGHYPAAERCFRGVDRLLERGSGNALLIVESLSLQSSLRGEQRRFSEATALLGLALRFQRQLEDPHLEGRLRVKLAHTQFDAGSLPEAYREILRALTFLDAGRDPELSVTALHNMIGYLSELGEKRLALAAMRAADVLYRAVPDELFRLRAYWLRAKLHRAEGELEAAAGFYRFVAQRFRALDLHFDAALASLELAEMLSKAGHHREVRKLAAEMYPVFEALKISREASISLLIWAEAAREDNATTELLTRAIADLAAERRAKPAG